MEKMQWFQYTEKILSKYVKMLLKIFNTMMDVSSSLVILLLVVMVLPLLLLGMLYILVIVTILKSGSKSEDRAHRIGQKDKVNYIDLIVPDSIEMMIISAFET